MTRLLAAALFVAVTMTGVPKHAVQADLCLTYTSHSVVCIPYDAPQYLEGTPVDKLLHVRSVEQA